MKRKTLPRLTKGILLALEHSGKCGRATDRVSSKSGCAYRRLTGNQRSIFLPHSLKCIQLLSPFAVKLSLHDTHCFLANLDVA